jgi:hypothetical protein
VDVVVINFFLYGNQRRKKERDIQRRRNQADTPNELENAIDEIDRGFGSKYMLTFC